MPHRLIAIFLLVALISSHFSRYLAFAGYALNQKYIASTLCENKSRPWMHCNGKCYLMKKIKAAEDKEEKQDKENARNNIQEGVPHAKMSIVFINHVVIRPYYPLQPVSDTINMSSAIFQPPRMA